MLLLLVSVVAFFGNRAYCYRKQRRKRVFGLSSFLIKGLASWHYIKSSKSNNSNNGMKIVDCRRRLNSRCARSAGLLIGRFFIQAISCALNQGAFVLLVVGCRRGYTYACQRERCLRRRDNPNTKPTCQPNIRYLEV